MTGTVRPIWSCRRCCDGTVLSVRAASRRSGPGSIEGCGVRERFTGGCLCGKVRIVASGPPRRVGTCHCLDCRKHHGALFYAASMFPSEAVTVEGDPRDYRGRFFCPVCGGSVFARSGDEVELHLGALDAPDQLKPDYECWTVRRGHGCRLSRGRSASTMTLTIRTPPARRARPARGRPAHALLRSRARLSHASHLPSPAAWQFGWPCPDGWRTAGHARGHAAG